MELMHWKFMCDGFWWCFKIVVSNSRLKRHIQENPICSKIFRLDIFYKYNSFYNYHQTIWDTELFPCLEIEATQKHLDANFVLKFQSYVSTVRNYNYIIYIPHIACYKFSGPCCMYTNKVVALVKFFNY